MARRQSRAAPSRPAPRPAARTAPAASAAPSKPAAQQQPAQSVPAQVQPNQVPAMAQPQQPGLFAQMASTAAGVAVGSTIGHTMGHAITGMFGGSSSPAPQEQVQAQPLQQQQIPYQQQSAVSPCEVDSKAFLSCLEKNDNDIGACQFYFDLYQNCMRSQQA